VNRFIIIIFFRLSQKRRNEKRDSFMLCKMSPAPHLFFFEKVKKNNDNKSVHSCCEETLRANFQSHFSFPVYFQELRQSKTDFFFFEIA
jgi:hypothetical protein